MKYTLLSFCLFAVLCVQAQTITTIVGKGSVGYSGDGSVASDCELNHPFGINVSNSGDLYIADRLNHCIRKVDASGTITTIAGTGTAGYNGDGISATAAMLNSPVGIYVYFDLVFIADLGNNRIRRVDMKTGVITTIAGTGVSGFGGDGGPATAAQLANPRGVSMSLASGNLYIADQGNNRIRMIDGSDKITTVAGNGIAGYAGDGGPATAASLNNPYSVIYVHGLMCIADVDNARVRAVNAGTISTLAGNGIAGYSGDFGLATEAQLNEPISVARDETGNVYIADGWNGRIRKLTPGGIITTVAGKGTLGYSGDGGRAVDAELNDPYGVAVDAGGNIYVADYANNRIRYITHPTAVPEIANESSRPQVFPNPNTGAFHVNFEIMGNEPMLVNIYNVLGQKVFEKSGMTNTGIDVNMNEPNGVYSLSAITKNGLQNRKIIICR